MPRYRLFSQDLDINVGRQVLRAGDDGVFTVDAGSANEAALIAAGAVPDTSLNASELASVRASVFASGNQLVTAAATGDTTGWMPALASAERFLSQPTGVTGTASVIVEVSNDGATIAATRGTLSMTSVDNGRDCYTGPVYAGAPLIRLRVANDGGGTHNLVRGV